MCVGHSMGGTIASLFAGLRPESLSSLVLVDGLGPPSSGPDTAFEQYRTFLDHQARQRRHQVFADPAAAALRLRRFNPSLDEAWALALARRATRPVDGGVIWRWDPRHRDRSAVAYDVLRHSHHLRRIAVPTTLVFGASGWYPKGIEDLEQRIEAIPHVVENISLDVGHAVHLEAASELAKIILRSSERVLETS